MAPKFLGFFYHGSSSEEPSYFFIQGFLLGLQTVSWVKLVHVHGPRFPLITILSLMNLRVSAAVWYLIL